MPRKYQPVKSRYAIGGMTQADLRALACPATLDEALQASDAFSGKATAIARAAVFGPAALPPTSILNAQRVAFRRYLERRLGLQLTPREFMALEHEWRAAIREARLKLTSWRGARTNATGIRILGSRRPIDAWLYLLMFRVRSALERAGIKPGAYGRGQQRATGVKEGRLFKLTRLAARLAGHRAPIDLDRVRREAARIERPVVDAQAKRVRISIATGPRLPPG